MIGILCKDDIEGFCARTLETFHFFFWGGLLQNLLREIAGKGASLGHAI